MADIKYDHRPGGLPNHHPGRLRAPSQNIWPGEHGKRIHVGGDYCAACRAGATAYEMPHQLAIRSRSRAGDMSTAHVIPWEGRDTGAVEWREHPEEGEMMYE